MKRGISLVVMLVTIAVILMITSVTVVTGNNIYNNTKKVKFASEISYVEEIVNTYRLNNNGNFPSSKMIYIDSSRIKSIDLNEQFNNENISDDDDTLALYKIDFSMLNPHELMYTDINNDSGDNVYCISPTTGRVYFVQGFKIGRKTYYTLTDDLKKSINYVEDNNVNDGIIFLDDYKGNLKIKIPDEYTDINITSSNGELTVTQDSITEYKIYNVSYTTGSLITVSYKKDNVLKELKYNVSEVSNNKPDFNISEIKTMVNSKTGKEEKYVTLENVPNNVKVIKYANQILNESKVRDYFKTSGIEISKDDVITIPNSSLYNIIVYIEDNFGNYNYKIISNANVESYIKSNLVLQVDGIENTLNGHSDNTNIWYDLSGNGNNLTLENVSWTDDSAVFNNSLAYTDNTVENITVEMVVKQNENTNGYIYVGYFGNNQHLITLYDNNKLLFSHNNKFYQGFNNYRRNTVCAIFETSQGVVENSFLNSVRLSKTADGTTWTSNLSHYIQIGKYTDNQWRFAGEICSIRIYNRALTEEEIKHNYEIDKIRFGL